MKSFARFLREKRCIDQRRLSHYLRWVRMYREYVAGHSDDKVDPVNEGSTAICNEYQRFRAFLSMLSRDWQEWQVRQARHALRLYYYFNHEDRKRQSLQELPAFHVGLEGLEERLIRLMRLKHLAYRTEKTYLSWVRRFRSFSYGRKLQDLTEEDLQSYLSHLAVERGVSAATQKQAFNALLFLFRNILQVQITNLNTVVPSRVPRRLPLVLTQNEVRTIFSYMPDTYLLMAQIIYGGGLRLGECISLRVKDVDFSRNCITIRSGKRAKDRETLLGVSAASKLRDHLRQIRMVFEQDRRRAVAGVSIPQSLAR
jgi:hypothetical protein